MKEKTAPRATSPCHCASVRRASRVVSRYYDRALAPSGLKITQYSLLRHVAKLGPVNVSRLAEAMNLERTTVVRNLKPLEDQGLVSGGSGKDLRTRELTLTPAGEKALEQGTRYWNQAQASLNDFLGEDDLAVFLGTLRKFEALPGE